MNCTKIYKDYIIGCPSGIQVNAVFQPETAYVFEIRDPQGNRYDVPISTDSAGVAHLDFGTLPEGFCNPYLPWFEIRVKESADACTYLPLHMQSAYETIQVSINAGTAEKLYVGCPLPVSVAVDHGVMALQYDISDTYQADTLMGKQINVAYDDQWLTQVEGQPDVGQFSFNTSTGTFTMKTSPLISPGAPPTVVLVAWVGTQS